MLCKFGDVFYRTLSAPSPKYGRVYQHSLPGEGRDPVFLLWTPAFAGETGRDARPTKVV
jgi:hypothetical protein